MGKVPASRVRREGCRRAKRLRAGMRDCASMFYLEALVRGHGDGEARRECLERKACSRGRRDADLAVRRIAKQLPLGVLHGTGDGAVHEPGDSELGHVQFAFQHCVLDQGETGRPGAKMEATASG